MANNLSIIRTYSAGVFFGEVTKVEDTLSGRVATIKNCRRLWYWSGAASLSQLALEGVKNPRNCKFTMTVPEMEVIGVIEIIPATERAIESINGVEVWKI